MNSYNFVLFSASLERVSSDSNTPIIDICSQSSPGSPTSTQEDEEDSPYAEVRASVSNMDDPEMPTTTFRMWFLGLILVPGGCCLNTFFNYRYPAPYLTPSLVLLMEYPLGKALAYALPTRTWVLPQILGGWKLTLNPGPFNGKEHLLIYMMANVVIGPAYVMNAIIVAEQYYGLDFGPGFKILLILATSRHMFACTNNRVIHMCVTKDWMRFESFDMSHLCVRPLLVCARLGQIVHVKYAKNEN